MANTLKLLYWLHKTKANKQGLAPLILRISYQKSKAEKATGYYVNPKDWNSPNQRKGKNNPAVSEFIFPPPP